MRKAFPAILLAATAALWTAAATAEDHGHRHHHQFPKDVDAFHAVLAPIWHSSPGPARVQKACAQAGELEKLAGDIRSADAKPLVDAVARLRSRCDGKPAEGETALVDVHDAFHRLIEAKRPAR